MYQYRFWIGGGVVCILGALGFLVWQWSRPQSLLPQAIVQKVHGFTPYFYKQMPAGYSADLQHAVYDNSVLMVSLTRNGQHVALTEQTLPADISMQDLQQGGNSVQNAAAPATINDVEGRLVGAMVAQKDHTLILVTATNNDEATKNDLTQLLRNLQPLR